MIRREESGRYLLIRQNDHAHLSRALAEQVGNDPFAPIAASPRGVSALLGIGQHDEGWPLHDDAPTLNGRGQPRDVFEPRPDALELWSESSRRAMKLDPYAGLLVSLHVLNLSVVALNEVMHQYSRQNLAYTRSRFDLNKFQHAQVELQHSLRTEIGLQTDLPLHNGVSEPGASPEEDLLLYHFRWLQAMDRLSLALCCTKPPFDAVGLIPRPGEKPIAARVQRIGSFGLKVSPWPFKSSNFTVRVPAKSLPLQTFASDMEFQDVVATAKVETLTFTVTP